MSTVGEIISRVFRDYLEAPDDQPTRASLAVAMSSSETTLTYSSTYLTPEEEELFGPGTIIEIDSEEILIGGIDSTTKVLSGLRRGMNGTDSDPHALDAVITLAPMWRRKSVFDAVADAVVVLYPELYGVATSASITLSTDAPTEVPADVARPLWFYGRSSSSSSDWGAYSVTFWDKFPASTTGKAITVNASGNGYLVYAKKFTKPASESVSLISLGVEADWENLVVLGAAISLISSKEFDAIGNEFLINQLKSQGFPTGSAGRVRDGMIRHYERLLEKAQAELRTRYATPVIWQ